VKINLLQETIAAIGGSGHTVEDIHFIGSEDGEYSMTWDEFVVVADVEYDSSYGSCEVATDLMIQFTDTSYMTRSEYDGSEWWDYTVPKPLMGKGKPITKLVSSLWPTVDDLQQGKK
jgi:hypothetical protein